MSAFYFVDYTTERYQVLCYDNDAVTVTVLGDFLDSQVAWEAAYKADCDHGAEPPLWTDLPEHINHARQLDAIDAKHSRAWQPMPRFLWQ